MIEAAFRRAISFFPSALVVVETGGNTLRADGFCLVSFAPPVVAVTVAKEHGVETSARVIVCSAGARLTCVVNETKVVGDHLMFFCDVARAEIIGGPALVRWRGASFGLKLDYPFLDSSDALERFIDAWRTGVLPKSDWTHAAHVAATGYFAFDRSVADVFATMKPGILAFNEAKGGVNGPDSGYHETLTQFWSSTIARAVHEARPQSRLEAARCAVRIFGEDRDLPSLFYSFDVVRDRRARREWVASDREP